MCFLVVLTLFFFKTLSVQGVYVYVAAASDNNGGRDHIIGFHMSSDKRTASNSIHLDLEAMIETNAVCRRRTGIFYYMKIKV